MEAIKKQHDITGAMEYALSSPLSRVGKRLRSEPDLADVFNVGRWHVRKSVNELVRRGVLVRRKGSGTYVQKIPELNLERNDLATIPKVLPESLFADDNGNDVFTRATPIQPTGKAARKYHIGLWSDLHCATSHGQVVLAHTVDRMAQRGHRLTVHSLVQRTDQPHTVDYIRHQLRENPCDGYLVVARWADIFLHALGHQDAPVLVFCTGYADFSQAPMLYLDGNQLVTQAIDIFAQQGLTKIALLGMEGRGHNDAAEQRTYEQAMMLHGLEYRACLACSTLDMREVMLATQELVCHPERPDALYVADDYLMPGVVAALEIAGLTPGKDIAVITLSNYGLPLPSGRRWSSLQFEHRILGTLMVDTLIGAMETGVPLPSSVAVHGRWIPGDTHFVADTEKSKSIHVRRSQVLSHKRQSVS